MLHQSALSQLLRPRIQALGQTALQKPIRATYVSIGVGAALGILAGVLPKKQGTLKHYALGGSVAALGLSALLFVLGD
jgi:hypothetical protein